MTKISNSTNSLHFIIDKNVPLKKLRDPFPPWLNSELKHLLIGKKFAHLNYKTARTDSNYDIFSKIRTRCKKLNNILYDKYIENTENNIKTNIKNFWNYVNSLKKDNYMPNIIKIKSITATKLEEKTQLCSAFSNGIHQFNGRYAAVLGPDG